MLVLYVDDDPAMTKTVDLMLRKAGHDCDTTYLGERAVTLANMKNYDVIILDIMLPDIDGYEVIERLREAQVSTPLLIQTGLVDRAQPGDAEAFGVDDILLKPFSQKELIDHLERAVTRPPGAERARSVELPPDAETAAVQASGTESAGDQGVPRRRGKRAKAITACEILFDGNTARAMVLNISERGAAVRLPGHLTRCPKYFTLKLPAGGRHDCRICWRAHDKVGVAFV